MKNDTKLDKTLENIMNMSEAERAKRNKRIDARRLGGRSKARGRGVIISPRMSEGERWERERVEHLKRIAKGRTVGWVTGLGRKGLPCC